MDGVSVPGDEGDDELQLGSTRKSNRIHSTISHGWVYLVGAALLVVGTVAMVTRSRHRPTPPRTAHADIHLTAQPGFRLEAEGMDATFAFDIANSGSHAVEVRYPVRRMPPGIALRDANSDSAVLAAHGSTGLTIGVTVTNCAAIPSGPWPLRVSARWVGDRGWVEVDVTPPSSGAALGWQTEVKRAVCPPSSP